MRDKIWTFVLLALFLGVFVPAFNGAAGATTFSVANEQVSISTDAWTTVDENAREYHDNETVYFDGSVVEESEYRWNTTNGSIKAVEGGALANASQATIAYSGERHNQWKRVLTPMLIVIVGVAILLTLIVAGDAVVDAIGAGGGR